MEAKGNKDDIIAEEYEEYGWADADRQSAEAIAREVYAVGGEYGY